MFSYWEKVMVQVRQGESNEGFKKDNKTPPEKCGIIIEGEDKWLTLIQNAEKNT
jgi:hypothetical protein